MQTGNTQKPMGKQSSLQIGNMQKRMSCHGMESVYLHSTPRLYSNTAMEFRIGCVRTVPSSRYFHVFVEALAFLAMEYALSQFPHVQNYQPRHPVEAALVGLHAGALRGIPSDQVRDGLSHSSTPTHWTSTCTKGTVEAVGNSVSNIEGQYGCHGCQNIKCIGRKSHRKMYGSCTSRHGTAQMRQRGTGLFPPTERPLRLGDCAGDRMLPQLGQQNARCASEHCENTHQKQQQPVNSR